jgi:hypothetical protein
MSSTNRGVSISKVVHVHEDLPRGSRPGREAPNPASTGSITDETKRDFDMEEGMAFTMTTTASKGMIALQRVSLLESGSLTCPTCCVSRFTII